MVPAVKPDAVHSSHASAVSSDAGRKLLCCFALHYQCAVPVRATSCGEHLKSCTLHELAHLVAAVEHINHALGVRVCLVAGVGRPVVHHTLVDGVGGLVGEDARGQARDQLLHLVDATALHDVVIDQDVLAVELYLVLHVAEQAAHLGKGGMSVGTREAAVLERRKCVASAFLLDCSSCQRTRHVP